MAARFENYRAQFRLCVRALSSARRRRDRVHLPAAFSKLRRFCSNFPAPWMLRLEKVKRMHMILGRIKLLVVGAAVVAAGAGSVRADLISSTSPYQLSISESMAVLANPGNVHDLAMASATTGHALAIERSEPYFLLTNNSETSSLLTFTLPIGDATDHFRFVTMVPTGSSSTSLTSAGVSMTGAIETVSTTQDTVTISFMSGSAEGLAPGESVEFRIGVAPDAPNVNPLVDYRLALNGSTPDATFNPPLSVIPTSISFGNQAEIQAAQAMCNCGSNNTPSTSLTIDPTLVITPTPEPSSIVLLALGCCGLAGMTWRKSRASRHRLVGVLS
jgi:PEP-CTERM motif